MKCQDVMTKNPACCVPTDTAARAAQLMRSEDVGSLPVVQDPVQKQLVGVITDRDLALRVLAEGRDPQGTRLEEIMSRTVVTCHERESVEAALDAMRTHQIRRIPVVDASKRVVGIIAQADIARNVDEDEVGETVEDISQPSAGKRRSAAGRSPATESDNVRTAARSLVLAAAGLGAGAALMYLLNPQRGGTSAPQDEKSNEGVRLYSATGDRVPESRQKATGQTGGLMASARSIFESGGPVSDDKLEARVKSKIGHEVSNAHSIKVEASDGHVTLRGPVLATEVNGLMRCVHTIPGVTSVENRLQVYASTEGLPGGRSARTSRFGSAFTSELEPRTRIAVSALGGGLLLFGLRTPRALGKASSTLGVGLIARGIGRRDAGRLIPWASRRGLSES